MSVIALPHEAPAAGATPRWLVLLARRRTTLVGATLMVAVIVIGLGAPWLAGSPTHMDGDGRPRHADPGPQLQEDVGGRSGDRGAGPGPRAGSRRTPLPH